MARFVYSLSGLDWQLRGYWPWVPIKDRSMETGQELIGVTDWMPATVPGGVHYDLYRAGWIEHPYYELNSLKCEWVENRWWVYKVCVPLPEAKGTRTELVFRGVDYEALFYLNGVFLGEHEGMYEPAVFDITSFVANDKMLTLKVVFKGVPQEMGQIGKTSLTSTQKSRFNYKWDFSTRLVNIGFWDDVQLVVHDTASLLEPAIFSNFDPNTKTGHLRFQGKILRHSDYSNKLQLRMTLHNPEGQLEHTSSLDIMEEELSFSSSITVPNPRLWWPNGYGEQPLYTFQLDLCTISGEVLDTWEHSTGIRSLTYQRNEGAPEEALPYTFVVNGRPIYIRGVNITPLDHVYGNVSLSQYDRLVYLMKRGNMNLVRVWGGGVIEKSYFYDLCDRHGILVWQEFIQSSSGIDNIPSKLPKFLKLLEQTAKSALSGRRNHVSLACWSGGNELMSAPNTPSTYEDENIAMLQSLVQEYDPSRLFLPTSASGPVEFVTTEKGVSHDVHGGWQFQGNPHHYELYGSSDNMFHSEFGVDGVATVITLTKILSPQHHYPTPMRDNVVWRHHGEWWGTFDRDTRMFGTIPDMARFSRLSQWMQAEGLRFIIEANRRRQFQQSGSVIWQLNEPWPNSSCTNLAEYFGELKGAYYAAGDAYSPLHVSLDYRKLDYTYGTPFVGRIYVHSNGIPMDGVTVVASVFGEKGSKTAEYVFNGFTEEDRSIEVGKLEFTVHEGMGSLFFIRLQLLSVDGRELTLPNEYIFGVTTETPLAAALLATGAVLETAADGDWEPGERFAGLQMMKRSFLVLNSGVTPAIHVHPYDATDAYWIDADWAYRTLMPGESMRIKVRAAVKQEGGFTAMDSSHKGKKVQAPDIVFLHLHSGEEEREV